MKKFSESQVLPQQLQQLQQPALSEIPLKVMQQQAAATVDMDQQEIKKTIQSLTDDVLEKKLNDTIQDLLPVVNKKP